MNQQQLVTASDTRVNLELARAFADATMVPDHFKKSIGNCLIAVNLANRFGMDPWTLMQELYVISGRPMMSGKLATAILNHSLAEPLRPSYSGEGDDRTIVLTGRLEGETEPLSVKIKVRDARTENAQWKKNPDQMLMYCAARMWGRRFAPDILLGIVFDDEEIPGVNAPIDGTPKAALARAQLASAPGLKPQADPPHDPETGEIQPPHEIEVQYGETGEAETFIQWAMRFVAAVRTSGSLAEIAAWNERNADRIIEIKQAEPKTYTKLETAINLHRIALAAGTEKPEA